MRKYISIMLLIISQVNMASIPYRETLCKQNDYFCIKIKAQETWDSLFANEDSQDLIQRINRMNTPLKKGMIIAIPKQLDNVSLYDVSPFPRYIEPTGEKNIYISQKKLAFAAYDESGDLIWWGPISSGIGPCHALGGCETPSGYFRIIRKQGEECISTVFPVRGNGENGGAEMPYCMHFFRGYALHGSDEVPGFRASHGCIRLFQEDARWLNEEFIDLPGVGMKGTRVIIEEL